MDNKLFAEINKSVQELCAERDIPIEKVQFFGSRIKGTTSDDSDVDMALVSHAFEGKDIFQRAEMTKGLHRALVKRFCLPFDIVFYSIDEWLNGNSPLLREMKA
jgi:predicted nucleotidyltransferase